MTLRQEANQMINVMPEDTLRILVELMQKMVPQSNAAQAVKGNISQYYGSMQIGKDSDNAKGPKDRRGKKYWKKI